MRKIILISLFIFVLSLPSIGKAATVGNSAETQGGLGKYSIGIEYDSVFSRNLDDQDSNAVTNDITGNYGAVLVRGAVGVHTNVDLFLKLGMANANVTVNYPTSSSVRKVEYEGGYKFPAYGIGAKAKLFEPMEGLRVMGDAQIFYTEVDNTIKVDGKEYKTYNPSTSSYSSKSKFQEFQVALYVNQTMGQFSPYLGIKYSDLKGTVENNFTYTTGSTGSGRGDVKGDSNFGIFLGTDIYAISNQLSINVEGRFLDEIAGTLGLNYRF